MKKLKLFLLIFSCLIFFEPVHSQSWQELNPPLNIFNGTIYTTALDAHGNIYAAGDFTDSSGGRFVAKWNGSNWVELGSLNANNTILSIVADAVGNIYAAGGFTNSLFNTYVAKWNGSSWSELGTGNDTLNANSLIYSITVDNAGNVYAAGHFTNASGHYYVAKWNGASWSELGTGATALNANKDIYAVTTDASGNIYAGGWFTNNDGKEYVAKWDGISWSELGSGSNALNANDFIRCIAADNSGNIYAGGNFRNNNSQYYLGKWNGSSWTELGSDANALNANNSINTIAIKNSNEIYVAGIFTDGSGNYYVAKWNGATWSQVNSLQNSFIANNRIQSIAVEANSNIYAGGEFTNNSSHTFIAKWNGTAWSEEGSKGDVFYVTNPYVYEIDGDKVGNVYVSGDAGSNGQEIVRFIKHWNGGGWNDIPVVQQNLFVYLDGNSFTVSHNMAVDKAGNLYATGRYEGDMSYDCVLKWNGQKWSIVEDFPNALDAANNNPSYNAVSQLEADANGNLYVIGNFYSEYSQNLAKWDGKKWSYLPNINGAIGGIFPSNDGQVYLFGSFLNEEHPYNLARLVNGTWQEMDFINPNGGEIVIIKADSKNNIYVNGTFKDSSGNHYIRKWDGANWSNIGSATNDEHGLAIDAFDNIYASNARPIADVIKKWNGYSWTDIPINENGPFPYSSLLENDLAGNIYTDGDVGRTILKLEPLKTSSPKISSFTPTSGSLGSAITITGKHLGNTLAVKFGGVNASSFTVNNDSSVTAVVANGASGNIFIETFDGADSIQNFIYTCDSIKGPVPLISSTGDSVLTASNADFYQWYLNNNKLKNENTHSLQVDKPGFYHVATSTDSVCWVPSMDYLILIDKNPLADTIKMNLYPNPSTGNFTVYVKLPQTTTVETYVKIFDAGGKLVLQTNKLIFYGNEIRIPILLNSKGTFYVTVYINKDSRQQTIIIL